MAILNEADMDVSALPKELQEGVKPDISRVRVTIQELTENGLTPEEEDDILKAAKSTDGDVSFDNIEDALQYIRDLPYEPNL